MHENCHGLVALVASRGYALAVKLEKVLCVARTGFGFVFLILFFLIFFVFLIFLDHVFFCVFNHLFVSSIVIFMLFVIR